jgi:hypothetical protein
VKPDAHFFEEFARDCIRLARNGRSLRAHRVVKSVQTSILDVAMIRAIETWQPAHSLRHGPEPRIVRGGT